MTRFSGKTKWLLIAVAITVAMSETAVAQRGGGGRGGRGGMGQNMALQLAGNEQVQAALELNEEQKAKVAEINAEARDQRRELMQGSEGGFQEMRGKLQEIGAAASAKLAEALTEAQINRLLAVAIQVNGAGSLSDPLMAKELGLSDEQKSQLAEARRNMQPQRGARGEQADLSPEERRARRDTQRAEADRQLLAVLTTEQQTKYDEIKAQTVEVDVQQLRRGGFGGRGGQGGPGGEGRGRRGGGQRDNDAAI